MRPFLHLHKTDVIAACQSAGLTWAEDPTNLDLSFARNKLRDTLRKGYPPGSAARCSIAACQPSKALATVEKCANHEALSASDSKSRLSEDRANSRVDEGMQTLQSRQGQHEWPAHLEPLDAADSCTLSEGRADSRADEGMRATHTGPDLTEDILRLVDACSEAERRLSTAAQGLWKRIVIHMRPDMTAYRISTVHLGEAEACVAVRALALILQVLILTRHVQPRSLLSRLAQQLTFGVALEKFDPSALINIYFQNFVLLKDASLRAHATHMHVQDVSGSCDLPLVEAQRLNHIMQPSRWPRAFYKGQAIDWQVPRVIVSCFQSSLIYSPHST